MFIGIVFPFINIVLMFMDIVFVLRFIDIVFLFVNVVILFVNIVILFVNIVFWLLTLAFEFSSFIDTYFRFLCGILFIFSFLFFLDPVLMFNIVFIDHKGTSSVCFQIFHWL